MASPLSTQTIQPAWAGMNTQAAPDYVPSGQGALVQNLLVDRDGRLPVRGPLQAMFAPASAGGGYAPFGVTWGYQDCVLVNYTNGAARKLYSHSLATGVGTAQLVTTFTLRPSSTVLGDYMYGVVREDGAGVDVLAKWQPATASFAKIDTGAMGGPADMGAVKAHLQRLFVLGGTLPTTAPSRHNRLMWSDAGGPTTSLPADWQDDVSGLPNQILFDADPQEAAIGLASVNRNLLLLMSGSLHLLIGDAPSNWSIRVLDQRAGCDWTRSVCEVPGGVVFASKDRGLQWTDGIDVRTLSGPVQRDLLLDFADATDVIVRQLNNDYLKIVAVASSTDYPNRGWLLHLPTGRWAQIAADATMMPAGYKSLLDFGHTRNYYYMLAPLTSGWAVYNTGRLVDVRGVGINSGGVDLGLAGATYPIVPTYWSRLVRLASPTLSAALHRVLVDYYASAFHFAVKIAIPYWHLQIVDGAGATVLADTALPAPGTNGTVARNRSSTDVHKDVNELQLRFTGVYDVNTQLTDAELFDATLEFQAAKQRFVS